MGKRSEFQRIGRDYYVTPQEAVFPLLPQLPAGTLFAEPCAGNGALIDILAADGHQCVLATDKSPQRDDVTLGDALMLHGVVADMFITNPPWSRAALHPIINHLSEMLPCWMLFDADWAFTRQSADLIRRCSKIVPVGRIKWMPGSPHVGKDNCAWYQFLPGHTIGPRFVGRMPTRSAAKLPVSTLPLFSRRSNQRALPAQPEGPPEARLTNGTTSEAAPEPAPRAAPVASGPDPLALLRKLRQAAGRPGPIPRLTGEVAGGDS